MENEIIQICSWDCFFVTLLEFPIFGLQDDIFGGIHGQVIEEVLSHIQ